MYLGKGHLSSPLSYILHKYCLLIEHLEKWILAVDVLDFICLKFFFFFSITGNTGLKLVDTVISSKEQKWQSFVKEGVEIECET